MKEQIRVLHILQRMEAGGTQALLMNLYRNIDRDKIQFDFFVEYPNEQFYDKEIISLGGNIYYNNVRNDYNIIKFTKNLEKIIKKNNYKVIHVHTYSIGYFVLKVAKKCGVPVRIAHSHNNETVRDIKYIPKKILQKLYTIYATDLFACSKEAGDYLYQNKEYTVLNNSIDSNKFIFKEEIRNKIKKELNIENNFVVGHVGRFHPQKNHNFLIDIFKELKEKKNNAKLLLIGTGPLETEIKNKVKKLDLENDIIFLGNKSNMNEIFMAMDIFIFPSLFEGLGIVAVESQAAGIPCLAADTLPPESIVSPLCKHISLNANSKEWAEKAMELSTSKYKHTNMQNNIIKAGYDIKNTAKKMEKYYLSKSKNQ